MEVADALIGFVLLLLILGVVVFLDVIWRQVRDDDRHDIW